ncbi:MAG TPA: endonuclease [Oligoflexus sp.]|uniref:endonuclease I family protein n=1 Tax=Oligoflexus sp. TaxID=1971216 RepID=UPI002D35175F|nr:endonuclease [Oligoflexus sp.]HYX39597.1 endonuclease [Oligoflexus sp.]
MFKKLLRILALGIALIGVYQYLQNPQQDTRPSRPASQETVPSQLPPQPAPASVPAQVPGFGVKHPRDFDEAKGILRKIYPRGVEIYCGCPYDLERKDRIYTAACGYKGQGARSKRIEWEHVVPASVFGQRFAEWKNGHPSCENRGKNAKGRNCARATSDVFARMEADLYNLLPSLGELNGARSNYPFGGIGGEPREFGRCDFEVQHRVAEPRKEIRGDLARIYFYMDARYPGFEIVHRRNEGLLNAWDRDDPMDDNERQRVRRIAEIQGNSFFIGRLSRLATASE